MSPHSLFTQGRDFLAALWNEASRDQITVQGAALAYYAVFSLGPLLFLIVNIAGLAIGERQAEGRVLSSVDALTGPSGAAIVRLMIEASNQASGSRIATWVGVASVIAGATGMVTQLKSSLNAIWGSEPTPPPGLIRRAVATVLSYVVPVLLIVVTGLLLWLSLIATALFVAFGERFNPVLPGGVTLWLAANQILAFLSVFGILCLTYKYLSDARPGWRDVLVGSLVTSFFFLVGKYAFGFYLAHSHVASGYGAAGSLVVVLVWIYYSSQILFVGGEIIKVYGRRPTISQDL